MVIVFNYNKKKYEICKTFTVRTPAVSWDYGVL